MTDWYYQKYIDSSYIYHTAINNIADLNYLLWSCQNYRKKSLDINDIYKKVNNILC